MTDNWDPEQYKRFAAERARPFHDLLALVQPCPDGTVIDLGCGTGELTVELHERTQAAHTVGIDSSSAMLAQAEALERPDLTFELGEIGELDPDITYDVVFSNAALHWLPDHPTLLRRLSEVVKPGGQIAVQVPANSDHPSHTAASETAAEEPFLKAMGGHPPVDPTIGVLPPEEYAELLYQLGFVEQRSRLEVYGHVMPSSAEVAEWTKGTTLVRFA